MKIFFAVFRDFEGPNFAHFCKNEFLGLKHSQETRSEIDVIFLFVHVSCSRRALEPSSAEIKNTKIILTCQK